MFDNWFNGNESHEEDEERSCDDNGQTFDLRNGSDYADVTEHDEVDRLVNAGQLERIYLISPLFGGAEDERNIVSAGQGAAKAKQEIDTAVMAVLEAGEDLPYDVVPDYGESNSLVPQRITFTLGQEHTYVIITW